MEAPVRLRYFLSLLCLYFQIYTIQGDLTVQDQYECGSYQRPKEVRITDRDNEIITSQAQEFYFQDRNCVLTIIGKKNYQIELELENIDIDNFAYASEHCGGLCCRDFLKFFNSYRVDNARLLPGISQWGMCGNDLPTKKYFQTTQNYVTIQFKTDNRNDYKTGFTITFRQYPWRYPGNVFPDGGLYGGWNDGSKNILRVDWSNQNQLPGDYLPGTSGPDYDKEEGGIQCYECQGCDVEFFEPVRANAGVRAGCYVCAKTWLDGYASSLRTCYTKTQHTNLLQTLIDSSVAGGKPAQDFRDCKKFMDSRGESRNYCFCDKDFCNSAGRMQISVLTILAIVLGMFLKQ